MTDKKNKTGGDGGGDNLPATPPVTKTDTQLYKEINEAKFKPRYQSKMVEHQKALKNPEGGFKQRKIHIPAKKITVDYSEIKEHQAYAIKKFQLYFMFELTKEQLDFLTQKPLNYFAAKKLEDYLKN